MLCINTGGLLVQTITIIVVNAELYKIPVFVKLPGVSAVEHHQGEVSLVGFG